MNEERQYVEEELIFLGFVREKTNGNGGTRKEIAIAFHLPTDEIQH